VEVVQDHFRGHLWAGDGACELCAPREDEKMKLKTKVSTLPVILQLIALAMDRGC
jgi:hypothetical protein